MSTLVDPSGHGPAWDAWRRAWCLFCLPGFVLALVLWHTGVVVEVAVLAGLVGGVCHLLAQDAHIPAGRARTDDGRWRSSGATGCETAVVAVSLAATASISVDAALLVASGMALSSPPVVDALLGRASRPQRVPVQRVPVQRAGHVGPPPEPPAVASPALQDLTVSELCHAWRASYVALGRADTVEQRVVLVTLRGAYLDELEARDAGALRAWLEAGARAAGGPERFLLPGRRDPEPPRAA